MTASIGNERSTVADGFPPLATHILAVRSSDPAVGDSSIHVARAVGPEVGGQATACLPCPHLGEDWVCTAGSQAVVGMGCPRLCWNVPLPPWGKEKKHG